jgi:hypothetical protein
VVSSDDASAPDAFAAETSETCETMQFEGTINRMTFAEALRTMRASGPGARGVELRGAKDTKGLECFDGMIGDLGIGECGGPLHITSIPRGTLSVDVDGQDCPLVEIPGLANVGDVHLGDASAVTDFSPLIGATRVGLYGYPSLDLIAPYVQQAQPHRQRGGEEMGM